MSILQVEIGSGVKIPKTKWERLLKQNVDSRFVKEAATAIWGTEVLKKRSVTGTLSNRAIKMGKTEAFPCLSPEKVDALRSKCASQNPPGWLTGVWVEIAKKLFLGDHLCDICRYPCTMLLIFMHSFVGENF